MPSARALIPALAPVLGLTLLLTSGCIEIPEFEAVAEPNDLGDALDETPSNCSPGTFECACRPDASCDGGLACVEGVCQGPDTGDGDGDPTGDGDGEPTGDGDGEPTGDGDGDGDGDPQPLCMDDSDCPYAHACNPLAECELLANYAFVTSQTFPADFGGIAAADELCQNAANQAGLDGTFLALLSDAALFDPSIRLMASSGWVRTDLRNFANDPYEMVWSASIYYPLTFDEFGTDLGSVPVYSGGNEGFEHCNSWTSTDPMEIAGLGFSGSGSYEWLSWSFQSCSDVNAHLYCFQTDNNWSDTPPLPPEYRRAFLSETWVEGSAGIAAMNQLCQDEAVAAGLVVNDDDVFLAWIATIGAAPNDTFDLGGPPWVRADNVSLVTNAGDLGDPPLYLAPLSVHANGIHGGGWVWTGSTGPLVPGEPDSTCDNWTDPTGLPAFVGYAGHVDEQFGLGVLDCSNSAPVYCLQQ